MRLYKIFQTPVYFRIPVRYVRHVRSCMDCHSWGWHGLSTYGIVVEQALKKPQLLLAHSPPLHPANPVLYTIHLVYSCFVVQRQWLPPTALHVPMNTVSFRQGTTTYN